MALAKKNHLQGRLVLHFQHVPTRAWVLKSWTGAVNISTSYRINIFCRCMTRPCKLKRSDPESSDGLGEVPSWCLRCPSPFDSPFRARVNRASHQGEQARRVHGAVLRPTCGHRALIPFAALPRCVCFRASTCSSCCRCQRAGCTRLYLQQGRDCRGRIVSWPSNYGQPEMHGDQSWVRAEGRVEPRQLRSGTPDAGYGRSRPLPWKDTK